MPTFTIKKNGQLYRKTANSREEAIAAVQQRVALDEADSQLDAMDGAQVQPTPEPPKKERGVMETFKGAIDAVATIGSEGLASAVGGTLGFIEGAVESGLDGTYGTQEGVRQIQETMQRRGDIVRRDPSTQTEAGKEILQSVGEVLDPLARADQLGPLAAAIPTAPVALAPRAAAVTARRAAGAVSEASEAAIRRLPGRGEDAPDTGVGAAEAEQVQQMMVTAREFGFEGDSAPTVGQATRDPDQLRFENEAAKTEPGVALQERRQSQQEQLGRVFDEKEEDYSGGLAFADDDDQGRAVQAALEARKAQRKRERDALYAEAKAAGELDEMIEIPRLPTAFKALKEMEGLVEADPVVIKMAQKKGLIDADGNPQKVTVQEVENFREFVNKAYDYAQPRDRKQRGTVMAALDAALDNSPSGKKYKEARANASDFRNEFFNSPLASRMTKNKKNANVPSVDPGKVYQTIRNGSLEEIDQIRNTMMATPEGQKQWGGIQARMIQDMRDKAFGTQQDGDRNQLATPSTFIKEIKKLSRSGKLKAILGNKEAQSMEDLAQLVSDLMTSPPGTTNHSNTVAALEQWARMAPDTVKRLPFLKEAVSAVGDANTKRKVRKALNSDSLLGSAL